MPRIIPPIQIPEENPRQHRIAWWVENTLVRWVKRSFNAISAQLRDLINFSLLDFLEDNERDLIEIIRPMAEMILNTPKVPDVFKSPIRKALNRESQAGIAVLISLAGGMIGGIISGTIGPIAEMISAETHNILRAKWFDSPTATAMKLRHIITEEQYKEILHHNGLSDESIRHLNELGRPLLNQTELANLLWRDRLSEGNVKTELEHYGYNEAQQQFLVDLMEIIPSPNELISMAVREAFNDEVAGQFGYDEGYPQEAADIAAKTGYSERFFRYAWRAHWDLPGLVQVREMRHRNIIDDNDVNTYLKAADLPVFWRDAISKWMYAEITRVDLRRIYSIGLLSARELTEHYEHLGYTHDDAVLLTQWTTATYLEEERDLTKSDILSMLKDGVLSEGETRELLSALNYREDAIELYIQHQLLKQHQEYESKIIGNVQDLYVAGIYDRTDVFDKLGQLDTPATFIEQSLLVWDVEKDKKTSKPTTAQLRDFAQDGIISWDTFRDEMRFRGYMDKYVEWYVALYQE